MTFEYPQDRETTAFSYPLILFIVSAVLLVSLMSHSSALSLLAALVLLLMAILKVFSLISLTGVSCSIHLDKDRAFPQLQSALPEQILLLLTPAMTSSAGVKKTIQSVQIARSHSDCSLQTP